MYENNVLFVHHMVNININLFFFVQTLFYINLKSLGPGLFSTVLYYTSLSTVLYYTTIQVRLHINAKVWTPISKSLVAQLVARQFQNSLSGGEAGSSPPPDPLHFYKFFFLH